MSKGAKQKSQIIPIAERIRTAIRIKGFKQKEIAKIMKVSQASIAESLSGRRNLTIKSIEKYAMALKVPVSSLLGRVLVIQLEDIAAIKEANHLYSFYFDEQEQLWITTSTLLSDNGLHFHGSGTSLTTSLFDLRKQISKAL